MKFAKLFEQTLVEESIPEEWTKAAIQYKPLKKRINKVSEELESYGLQKEVLKALLNTEGSDSLKDEKLVAAYLLAKEKNKVFPTLKINLSSLKDSNLGLPKETVESLSLALRERIAYPVDNIPETIKKSDSVASDLATTVQFEEKSNEVTLHFHNDSRFFAMLNEELNGLDNLKQVQESGFVSQVRDISEVLASTADPHVRKSDMYIWREIFRIYLESEVYFKYNDEAAGERTATQSRNNLNDFITRVQDSGLSHQFRNKRSTNAFNQFVAINFQLLKALQFQTMNKMAITKILKKFDKQTSLTAKTSFPRLISNDPFIQHSFAKTVCAIISGRLLVTIPQLDDYSCPICTSVAYKPVKLDCGHVFCVRCLVILQKQGKDQCPLCREHVVMKADSWNMDVARMKYVELYFPKEVKEKMKERAQEQIEAVYGKQKCVIQ